MILLILDLDMDKLAPHAYYNKTKIPLEIVNLHIDVWEFALEKATKIYPPDIKALDDIRNKIGQSIGSKIQLMQQLKTLELAIKRSTEFEANLKKLEPQCIKLQKEKLVTLIAEIKDEAMKKAQVDAAETISKDPDAYLPEQVKQLPYLNYQKLLATNEKIAKEIAPRIITDYLYDKPIFTNPFKD